MRIPAPILSKLKRSVDTAPRRHAGNRLEAEGAKFRRSATLTGSLSDNIKAGAETNGQLQSPRIEAQAKRQVRKRWGRRMLVLAAVLFCALVLWANRITGYQIVFVDNPTTNPPTHNYIATAQAFRSTKLANRLSPTLHTAQLEKYLMAAHKEIAMVQVRNGLFNQTPQLAIALRRPVLLWHTRQDKQIFYVDAAGTPFALNAYGNDKQLVQVNDESGVPAELGAPVASSRQIRFLGMLVGQVAASSENKLRVARIVFPPSSTKEVDVFLAGRNYFIKVYMERPAKAQGEAIVQGVNALAAKGKTPAEYMDVRSAEKVFYK